MLCYKSTCAKQQSTRVSDRIEASGEACSFGVKIFTTANCIANSRTKQTLQLLVCFARSVIHSIRSFSCYPVLFALTTDVLR